MKVKKFEVKCRKLMQIDLGIVEAKTRKEAIKLAEEQLVTNTSLTEEKLKCRWTIKKLLDAP